MTPYKDFTKRFAKLIEKNPDLITTTLSNIFTMRLIGNKTHGDLAEIAIVEFINQYMYDFRSDHVGKERFRKKEGEEDILVTDEISGENFKVSLKAFGSGNLQISTDKSGLMFATLKELDAPIEGENLSNLLNAPAFTSFESLNVLALIYDNGTEKKPKLESNILIFDFERAKRETRKIVLLTEGKGRKHPVYRFFDSSNNYICEVRYGGGTANALQRGLWTHTEKASPYFESITKGWITYAHNKVLVQLFSHALLTTQEGHEVALEILKQNIELQKNKSVLQ